MNGRNFPELYVFSSRKEWYHKTAALPLGFRREKHDEEAFEFSRSGHGSGKTDSEKPETYEHSQELEDAELIDKEILNRHIEVKGDSWIPVKFPAILTFVPITFCKVIFSKTEKASGSNLSSGCDPYWPMAPKAVLTFLRSIPDMMISLT